MERTERALVICDGDLTGLVAVAAAQEAAAIVGGPLPVVWARAGRSEAAAVRVEAVERHAAAYGLKGVVHLVPSSVTGRSERGWPGLEDTLQLLDAATVAVEHECDRIVWPVHEGGDGSGAPAASGDPLDRITKIVDRALLATRLIGLDADEHGRPALRVETPYADLTDRQVADLAVDLDVAVESCWWWRPEFAGRDLTADTAPLNGHEAAWAQWRRWHAALRAVGWSPITAGA